jgi:amino acid adenylation domain-containing protein
MNDTQLENYWLTEFSTENVIIRLDEFPQKSLKKSIYTLEVPAEVEASLTAITGGAGIGRFIYSFTCLAILLRYYSGEDSITVATPALSPKNSISNNLCFIKSLIHGDAPGKDALNTVKEKIIQAFRHQAFGYKDLITKVRRTSDFNLEDCLEIGIYDSELQTNNLLKNSGVVFSNIITNGKLYLSIEYNEHLDGQKLLNHYLNIFIRLVMSLNSPIRMITLLSDHEQNELLFDFNTAKKDLPLNQTFVDLFEVQVKKNTSNIAIQNESALISYYQLNKRVHQYSALLHTFIKTQGDKVIVFMDRSDEMIAAIIAIWKAGLVYLPIDPTTPLKRLSYIMKDGETDCILTERKYKDFLKGSFSDKNIIFEEDAAALEPPITLSGTIKGLARPDDLAYIIYTSGSTGAPKGVMIEHRGLLNHLLSKVDDLHLTDESIVAQNASQGFDISIWQMMSVLLVGGRVVIYKELLNINQFAINVMNDRISVLELVPTYLSSLIDHLVETKLKGFSEYLKYLIVTGEEFKYTLFQKASPYFANTTILNAYGPTEASDDVTVFNLKDLSSTIIPIGKPIMNTHIYVVNKDMHLCPIGVKGEICVSGIGVGRGYINDPEKTHQKFFDDPFRPGNRIYKTGDIGRWMPDGFLHFLGRKDDQVKILGNRVELDEISHFLLKISPVKDAVVVMIENNDFQAYLHAFISFSNGHALSEYEIMTALKQHLPSYMIPSIITICDSLPVNINGKIDIPKLKSEHKNKGKPKPCDKLSSDLLQIWREVLQEKNLDIDDNFFEKGGQSLKVAQAIIRINDLIGCSLDMRCIFDFPTITNLTQFIRSLDISTYSINHAPKREVYEI